ncbi:L-threonylcarbamoyladenylate synthase [Desulfonatronum thioautotrophicum]|uniref:L-threonylcarbamoyladenylate synthase n=1 Tax=Desulfonatronum thioautotrophicum TaxID=617001 RepID=UPI00069B70FC|nr:L-threonylcarbamoyladenylate synthase [Desulfonatronum thioautotrophicum]
MTKQSPQQEMFKAVAAIRHGMPVVYPTETLYALGVDILRPDSVEQVVRLKGRPQDKPLPVLIGALDQLSMVTDHQSADLYRLTRNFWPGPLSILVPARPGLSSLLQDQQGFIAVRWTPHPTAQFLAVQGGAPLTATSANTSGRPAASRPEELDTELLAALSSPGTSIQALSGSHDSRKWLLPGTDPDQHPGMVIRQPPYPAGGRPSTVVQILSSHTLHVFRLGAIGLDELEQAGWRIG